MHIHVIDFFLQIRHFIRKKRLYILITTVHPLHQLNTFYYPPSTPIYSIFNHSAQYVLILLSSLEIYFVIDAIVPQTSHFYYLKKSKKKADQESQLPIGIFSYFSSFLHSISVPSRNTTNNVPSSKTLMWSSVFSMKSVSISVKGSAPSVYSMNFSAR